MTYSVRPIGFVRSTLREVGDAPNQAFEGAPEAVLEIDPQFAEALHLVGPGQDLILLTWLHRADREVLQTHPRGDPSTPLTGVFLTRSPDRPNPIGLHHVRITAFESPTRLHVSALEAIDGTPIVDLKVVMSHSPRRSLRASVRRADVIRPYRPADEEGWLRCRVLSFLGSAYFDDVRREKEEYANPSIELVAEEDGEIVGLIDVECELEPGTVCEDRPGLGGMIWHLAVHPDHQRRGVATALLAEAERLAAERDLVRFEAWTRDDPHVQRWYETHGFERVYAYLHVYIELDDGLRDLFPVNEDIRPVKVFAHYTGEDREAVRRRFGRVHDCVLYERRFGAA